jgi:uncharacterized protein YjbI with pentapeptide repeats
MNEETERNSAIKRLWEQIVGVFRFLKNQWQTNPLPSIVVVILLLLLAWITWETRRLGNLGFGDKAFWDWMDLFIIPIVVGGGAAWLNKSQRENELRIAEDNRKEDRRIAEERRHQATLEAYFDRMTELLLKEGLRDSKKKDDEVRSIARTRTLAVLRSLGGRRKGQVVQFLYESRLVGKEPVVELKEADVSGAHLHNADLHEANLDRANLCGATFFGAYLRGAILSNTDLREAVLSLTNLDEADLSNAKLREANLRVAYLREAKLVGANLREANLREANLHGADLSRANLTGADLSEANLTKAKVANEQLAQAKSLKGATLPDGTKVPDGETAEEQE